MIKLLKATCNNKQVKIDDKPAVGIEIQSNGQGESSGFVLMQKDTAFYLANGIDDIKTLIDSIIKLSEQIQAGIQLIPASSQHPSPTIGQQVQQNIQQIKEATNKLTELKDNLK